jgi:uncharacterized protein
MDTLATIKKKTRPILEEENIQRSSLFGSYVHGNVTPKSDIDILVDMPKGSRLLDLIRLKHRLEKELGKKVDVVTYRSLSPHVKKYILAHTISLT